MYMYEGVRSAQDSSLGSCSAIRGSIAKSDICQKGLEYKRWRVKKALLYMHAHYMHVSTNPTERVYRLSDHLKSHYLHLSMFDI